MIETTILAYTDEADLAPWCDAGWTIVAVLVVCGLSAVYLQRRFYPTSARP